MAMFNSQLLVYQRVNSSCSEQPAAESPPSQAREWEIALAWPQTLETCEQPKIWGYSETNLVLKPI
jgi:hypothetical protein